MKFAKIPRQLQQATLRFVTAWIAGVSVGMMVLAAGAVVREVQARSEVVVNAGVTSTGSPEGASTGGFKRMSLAATTRCAADRAMTGWLDQQPGQSQDFTGWVRVQDAMFGKARGDGQVVMEKRATGCVELWKDI